MPNKINGLEPRPARVSPATAVRPAAGAAADMGNDQSGRSADVRLTSAARNLAAIEESLRNSPAVDDLRVAAVKHRLEDGTFGIDPQRIADRLLRLEHDLSGAAPLDSPLK